MTFDTQEIILNMARNVRLTVMLQSVGGEFGKIIARPAVLILPGGAYVYCSDNEAEAVAYPFLHAGYHAFVLRYSLGEHNTWPNPLTDYEETMELIRGKAEEWHILRDKIAVIGFSAGGHLAACAATMSKNRPNAAILGYAALDIDITSGLSSKTPVPAPCEHVDEDTCPCFLFAARDDMLVPVRNDLAFENALIDYGIQFESHIYAFGGHGYGTGVMNVAGTTVCRRLPSWTSDSISWLEDIFGQLTPEGMGEPVLGGRLHRNKGNMLSTECTIGHLRSQTGEAERILSGLLDEIKQRLKATVGEWCTAPGIMAGFTLANMMRLTGYAPKTIEELDATLRKIPNQR